MIIHASPQTELNPVIGSETTFGPKPNVDLIARIRALWGDPDLTATQIGELVGLNKNQILGLAHRNRFTPKRLAAHIGPRRSTLDRQITFDWEREKQPGPRECHFPLWAHGEPANHRYCCAPAKLGQTYCRTHHAICWAGKPQPVKRVQKIVGRLELVRTIG